MKLRRRSDSSGYLRLFGLRDGSPLELALDAESPEMENHLAEGAVEDYPEHLEVVPTDEVAAPEGEG